MCYSSTGPIKNSTWQLLLINDGSKVLCPRPTWFWTDLQPRLTQMPCRNHVGINSLNSWWKPLLNQVLFLNSEFPFIIWFIILLILSSFICHEISTLGLGGHCTSHFKGSTTICLRTFRLRHFVYRHFVYRHFVYYCIPAYRTVIHSTYVSEIITFINSNLYLHYDSFLSIPLPLTLW